MATRSWIRDSAAVPAPAAFGRRSTAGAPMPAAFGGAGDDPRREQRRLEERARHEARAREEAERRAVSAAEEKHWAAVRDFSSEKEYPTLGGRAPAPAKKAPTVWTTGPDETARPTPPKPLSAVDRILQARAAATAAPRRPLITNRCYDDGPEDYDGPDEEDYDASGGEFNPHLSHGRRSGW